MRTIHTPANFDPANYEIVDYIDNKRPAYYGQPIQQLELEIREWTETNIRLFGENFHSRIHKCEHCNHSGHVRYIAVVNYIPTNTLHSFGYICAERLEIKDKAAFRLRFIKDKASIDHAKAESYKLRAKFNETNEEFLKVLENASKMNLSNGFLIDIIAKFHNTNNVPSELQVKMFLISFEKYLNFQKCHEEEQTQLTSCPEGRITISGTILAIKNHESQFGLSWKMLVLDDRKFKIWGSLPSKLSVEDKGKKVKFDAMITKSNKDQSFGFFKRPTKVCLI